MAGWLYYTCLFVSTALDQPELLQAEVEIPCKEEYKGKPGMLKFSGHAPFSLLCKYLSEVLVLKQKHWDTYTGIVHAEVCHDASLSHQHYVLLGTQPAGVVYLFSEVK